mmetsp:Transcript_3489/g.12517  ORF Transcript_3489/g.12517 Transcript_3489/m.12517 type:complete len:237 (-) Transcript_3489:2801-3511(-)
MRKSSWLRTLKHALLVKTRLPFDVGDGPASCAAVRLMDEAVPPPPALPLGEASAASRRFTRSASYSSQWRRCWYSRVSRIVSDSSSSSYSSSSSSSSSSSPSLPPSLASSYSISLSSSLPPAPPSRASPSASSSPPTSPADCETSAWQSLRRAGADSPAAVYTACSASTSVTSSGSTHAAAAASPSPSSPMTTTPLRGYEEALVKHSSTRTLLERAARTTPSPSSTTRGKPSGEPS